MVRVAAVGFTFRSNWLGLLPPSPTRGRAPIWGRRGPTVLSQGDSQDEEDLHCHCRGRFARPGNELGAYHGRSALLGPGLRACGRNWRGYRRRGRHGDRTLHLSGIRAGGGIRRLSGLRGSDAGGLPGRLLGAPAAHGSVWQRGRLQPPALLLPAGVTPSTREDSKDPAVGPAGFLFEATQSIPHPIQSISRRPAVELEAVRLLERAERKARLHAGLSVDLVLIKAALGEQPLHALEVGGLELHHLFPGRLEQPLAGDAVGKAAAEQHVEIGEIVALD